jgi:DNA-binding NarL/FixJ family response regulator
MKDENRSRHPAGLTAREVEVLCHVAPGKTNQEIGRDLNISENTVSDHFKHIYAKTDTNNRVAGSSYAIGAGLVLNDVATYVFDEDGNLILNL